MKQNYDIVIIGGGHNGLVTAAYTAKAGRSVLVLEKRDQLGGLAATEEIFPGFKVNTGSEDIGLFQESIIKELNLSAFDLEFIQSPTAVFAPHLEKEGLILSHHDIKENQKAIASFSAKDAESYPEYVQTTQQMAQLLRKIMLRTPPDPFNLSLKDASAWGPVALALRAMGGDEMMRFIRVLPMTTQEYLNEWFENEVVQGVLGAPSVRGSMQGPQSAGTAFMLLYHQIGRSSAGYRSSLFVKGGTGKLSKALAQAAKKYGAEIQTNAEVEEILLEEGRAVGVRLASGEEVNAKIIISNLAPKLTFFSLLNASNLPPRIMRKVRNIRYRGSTAKLFYTLKDLPVFIHAPEGQAHLSGYILINPTLGYLEKAYDEAKHGRISQAPSLEIRIPTLLDPSLAPDNRHILTVQFRYAPYTLNGKSWDSEKETLDKITQAAIEAYAPGFKDLVDESYVISPLDYETLYGSPEGNIYHGQMGLDQMLFMRPIAGYAQYRSPIENLLLCSAGTHPGGGVTGAPGYNAAKAALNQIK